MVPAGPRIDCELVFAIGTENVMEIKTRLL